MYEHSFEARTGNGASRRANECIETNNEAENRVSFSFEQACKTYETSILFNWGVLLGSLALFLFFSNGFCYLELMALG